MRYPTVKMGRQVLNSDEFTSGSDESLISAMEKIYKQGIGAVMR